MKLVYTPRTGLGPSIAIYLDGQLGATQTFTNPWTSSGFTIILTGQGRATGDSVAATFSNLATTPTPEPVASAVLGLAALGLLARRRQA